MSNTTARHIQKLLKSIDNKLFDLLVDLEDQNNHGYDRTNVNYNLRDAILDKIIADKNIQKEIDNKKYSNIVINLVKTQTNMIAISTLNRFNNITLKPDNITYTKDIYNFKCISIEMDPIIRSRVKRYNKLSIVKQQDVEINHLFARYGNKRFCSNKKPININNNQINKNDNNNNNKIFIDINEIPNNNENIENDVMNDSSDEDIKEKLMKKENPYDKIKNFKFTPKYTIEESDDDLQEDVKEVNDKINYIIDNKDNINNKKDKEELNYIMDCINYYNDNLSNIRDNMETPSGIKISENHKDRDRKKFIKNQIKMMKKYNIDKNFKEFMKETKKIDLDDI